MEGMIITETRRLLLRQFEISDVEAMCHVLCDSEVMLFSMGVLKPMDVVGWIKRRLEEYASQGFGIWCVVVKETSSVIGYCGLTKISDFDGQPEIELGFRLARRFWFNGYATESATSVRDYAFRTLMIPRLIALVDPGNTASIRVVEKLGMTFERDIMLPEYDYPDRLYVIHSPTSNGK